MEERTHAVIVVQGDVLSGSLVNLTSESLPYTFRPLSLTMYTADLTGAPLSGNGVYVLPFFTASPEGIRGGSSIPNDAMFYIDPGSTNGGFPGQVVFIPGAIPITLGDVDLLISRYHGVCFQVANATAKDLRFVGILHVEVFEGE
jgi:hypothetical protein